VFLGHESGPRVEYLEGELHRGEPRSLDVAGLPFFGCAHVEKYQVVSPIEGGGHLRRPDVKRDLHFLTLTDASDHGIQRVRDIVGRANLLQRVAGLVAATGAPSDVVALEQAHLGAGIGVENLRHGGVGTDLR